VALQARPVVRVVPREGQEGLELGGQVAGPGQVGLHEPGRGAEGGGAASGERERDHFTAWPRAHLSRTGPSPAAASCLAAPGACVASALTSSRHAVRVRSSVSPAPSVPTASGHTPATNSACPLLDKPAVWGRGAT
jgi:hypothetical protein